MSLLENLKWRYATKKYDPTKKVAQEKVDKIIEAARMAPTSSGMQQFRVIEITDQELKNKIVPIARGQEIVAECSHLLVFAAWDKYTEKRIDDIFEFTAKERDMPMERYKDYTDRLKKSYLAQSEIENFAHTARQSYIGLAMALAQAAELKVDATPMEGFTNEELDKLLALNEKGLKSVTLLPLGYRDENKDWLVNMKKVRIPKEEFIIKY